MPGFAETAIRRITGLDPFPLPPVIRTRHPVVLMHGFGLLAGMRRGGHLYNAASYLRMHGVMAYAPNVVPYNTVAVRTGMWLERFTHVLSETGAEKLNLIAHSMGGLDARYLIAQCGLHDRVATLTTIATPHRGTHIAEFIVTRPERLRDLLADLADWLGTKAV
ncbi:MAG: lipase, partial [Rhodothermales bacterium]|nr:lipase [Rhodothermales bacterium]